MSKNISKKFYTKILKLLQSKKYSNLGVKQNKEILESIHKSKDFSDVLVKLGLNDIHAFIEALKGGVNNLVTEEINPEPILFDYIELSTPILGNYLKKIEQSSIPRPAREALNILIQQNQILQIMISGVRANNFFPIMDCLIKSYPKQTPELRQLTATTLKKVGHPVVLALIQSLYHEDDSSHSDLPELLKEMGYLAIPALIIALNFPEENVRFGAAGVLMRMKAKEAVPALMESLQDPSWKVRQASAEALGELSVLRSTSALIPALRDKHAAVRLSVARALGKIKGDKVLDALLELLEDPSWEIRKEAVESIAKFGPQASGALAKALGNDSLAVRKIASRILADIGTEEAVPALMKAIYDKDISVRERAVIALGRIQKEDSVVTLMYALEDKAPLVRFAAVQVLINVGTRATLHLLTKARKDSEPVIKQRADVAIQTILKREEDAS